MDSEVLVHSSRCRFTHANHAYGCSGVAEAIHLVTDQKLRETGQRRNPRWLYLLKPPEPLRIQH